MSLVGLLTVVFSSALGLKPICPRDKLSPGLCQAMGMTCAGGLTKSRNGQVEATRKTADVIK